ncbi:MAG: hypothetical protein JXM69_07925 [Anaerolineae bacterium]|nr:hypothetical protein [Anaerolineae bacterium]
MATSLELAITAIRSNRKDEGRQLLNLLIQENPNNELAWLWMSSVVNTDEQRARCLYHVLAINPDNEAARRGLQLLGIVVSDSRPVKVPRDSQPIQIPKPSPPNTQFIPDTKPLEQPSPSPPAQAQPISSAERRPFRLDRQAVVEELPFKPITKPFTDIQQSGAATPPATTAEPAQPAVHPSEPVPVAQTNGGSAAGESGPMPAAAQANQPSEPMLAVQTGPLPQPTVQPQAVAGGQPVAQPTPYYLPQPAPASPQYFAGAIPSPDTRPSQPVPVVQGPSPSQPMSVVHANVTMGMPTQYGQIQGYGQPGAPIHSDTTMMMPPPNQLPYGNAPYPSEPVPAVHSNPTMGMPTYGPAQGQQPYPYYQAGPSNSTVMPVGGGQFFPEGQLDYRVANAPQAAKGSRSNQAKNKNEDEEEEINVLAVVIFGSLSVTALGGLGMLILLMFAT